MDEMSKNMSFEYGDEPKFREGECGHVYFDTGVDESTEAFAKNVKLAANTEYTAHKNARAQGPAVTIDISKTLFDKEEPVEEASNEETP